MASDAADDRADRPALLAISDLHVGYSENRQLLERIHPGHDEDWLIVAGDCGELFDDVLWVLGLLSRRFAQVIWVPGNHELWTSRQDPVQLRGEYRYQALVDACRAMGVLTPEDPYPIWAGPGGPITVVPLFLLYDYTFLTPGTTTAAESLSRAHQTGIVCADEFLLHPDPYPSREAWCAARLDQSEAQLAERDPRLPTVLVNHWPLLREPTRVLRYPQFAQWCGTQGSADWHRRFDAQVVVYGHLHIPRTTRHDGVRFEEVSVGSPAERRRWGLPGRPRPILGCGQRPDPLPTAGMAAGPRAGG